MVASAPPSITVARPGSRGRDEAARRRPPAPRRKGLSAGRGAGWPACAARRSRPRRCHRLRCPPQSDRDLRRSVGVERHDVGEQDPSRGIPGHRQGSTSCDEPTPSAPPPGLARKFQEIRHGWRISCLEKVEPTLGFEPRTCCLRNSCSTAELCRPGGHLAQRPAGTNPRDRRPRQPAHEWSGG